MDEHRLLYEDIFWWMHFILITGDLQESTKPALQVSNPPAKRNAPKICAPTRSCRRRKSTRRPNRSLHTLGYPRQFEPMKFAERSIFRVFCLQILVYVTTYRVRQLRGVVLQKLTLHEIFEFEKVPLEQRISENIRRVYLIFVEVVYWNVSNCCSLDMLVGTTLFLCFVVLDIIKHLDLKRCICTMTLGKH